MSTFERKALTETETIRVMVALQVYKRDCIAKQKKSPDDWAYWDRRVSDCERILSALENCDEVVIVSEGRNATA